MAMPKAQRIQQSITTRLKKLQKTGVFAPKDFDLLDKRTHELYTLALDTLALDARKDSNKLEEIKKIIERS